MFAFEGEICQIPVVYMLYICCICVIYMLYTCSDDNTLDDYKMEGK